MATQQEIRDYISTELGRTVDGLGDADSLLEAGILDSMGVVALVSFIQEHYGIAIADEEMMPENFDTFDAIAAFAPASGALRIPESATAHHAAVRLPWGVWEGGQQFWEVPGDWQIEQLRMLPELDVRIARDARGFAASATPHGQTVADAARSWVHRQQIVAELTARVWRDRCFQLPYEDLCADPDRWLGDLYQFCGVAPMAPPAPIVPRQHHVLGNAVRHQATLSIRKPDRWRERVSAAEIAEVMMAEGAMNRGLRYDEVPGR